MRHDYHHRRGMLLADPSISKCEAHATAIAEIKYKRAKGEYDLHEGLVKGKGKS